MSEDSQAAILSALDKVMSRLDSLEAKVDAMGGGASTALAGPLASKLAEPDVAAGLARILDRVEALESTTVVLANLAERAPVMIDGGAAVLEGFMSKAEADGIDVFDRGFKGAALLEKASRPENLALVDDLLDKAAELAPLLDKAADAAPLLEVVGTPEFQKLLDSGLLDASVLGTAGSATTALVETRKSGFEPVGLFGTLGKLGDSDVQKAMGFLFALAKRFGAQL